MGRFWRDVDGRSDITVPSCFQRSHLPVLGRSIDTFTLLAAPPHLTVSTLTYQTRPHISTPNDIGLTPLYNIDEPPRTALTPLLHSFLHTLLRLIDVMTNTARRPDELAQRGWGHEGDQVGLNCCSRL